MPDNFDREESKLPDAPLGLRSPYPTEKQVFREYLESFLIAVLIALFLRTFVIAAYKIPTGSMTPTLKVGDCIFAWKLPYGIRVPFTKKLLVKPKLPARGDVIVFRYPEDESLSFVKRVIGLPGDKIEIHQKKVFVNDKLLVYRQASEEEEKQIPLKKLYTLQRETIDENSHFVMLRNGEVDDSFGPVVIPPEQLFVLGDNRDSSDDSRFWGMVPVENLEGKAFLIWASFDWEKRSQGFRFPPLRVDRLMTLIH
jgi:signal peptidase I